MTFCIQVIDDKIEEEEKLKAPLIEFTKDYDVFKTMKGNRSISENHVNNLSEFIQKRDLLPYNPILVNEYWEVIDGQHRLEAARRLKKNIFYIQQEGLSYKDAGILNACTDDFEFREYLDLYLKNGQTEYIKLDEFKTKNNISFKRLRYLMSKDQKRIFDERFKIGLFHIVDNLEDISEKIRKIDEVISYLEKILIAEDNKYIHTDTFWKGLFLFLEKDISVERFKEKISMKYTLVRQMSGFKDYLRLFTDLYNYKAKHRLDD